jgi:hypothetical protein
LWHRSRDGGDPEFGLERREAGPVRIADGLELLPKPIQFLAHLLRIDLRRWRVLSRRRRLRGCRRSVD